jgi:hypothetical protein
MLSSKYRMQHRAITCGACLQLNGKPIPADARDWLRPAAGHAMFLTRQGPIRACDLGTTLEVPAVGNARVPQPQD